MPQATTLDVYPNPYAALDARARPSGAFPWDPEHKPERGHVGASRRVCEKTGDLVFDFDKGPLTLPNTIHYRRGIQSCQLVAADAATADACGFAFDDPKAVLDAAKTDAAKHWRDQHGEPPPWSTAQLPLEAATPKPRKEMK